MHIELKKICVPTDFSPHAEQALRYGATMAASFGAKLHLLHVVQDIDAFVTEPTGMAGWSATEILDDLKKGAAEGLKETANRLPAELQPVVQTVTHGIPFHEISRYAKQEGIDLIILGTHGRTGLKHFLLGSVAERVVRSAPCPVLTVRHPEHEFVIPE
ncbi:MAG: universal stress protein [Planctomycetota bacterium]